ncbi:TonB-dependent receptor [Candidatus Colwellia aromaticivorans]|uniref:TonB-dependent receptor n=1 Tax=Candidatus Colwellia aromaticivorans TaxID=2267621 RepID=UPI0014448311|nr:TonB-dependent receptor [Candidatus Colwellia aromaticivorans]
MAEENSIERHLEVITITARRIEESVQQAPISVSVVDGSTLERAGIDAFDMLLASIPNATQSGGVAGGLQGLISIRGISTLVRTVGIETGVGMYIDGVYIGRPENFNFDLLDINRIEVLRGPQGAVSGKNTIAGAINIITNTPNEDFVGVVEAQYGNYDHIRLRTTLSGEIGNNTFASLTANFHRRDGYVENFYDKASDLDNADLQSTRGKLRYHPNEDVDIVLSVDYLRERSNPSFLEVSDAEFITDPSEETPFTVNSDQPNYLNRDNWGLSISSSVTFDNAKWVTLVARRGTSFHAGIDEDKLPVRFFVEDFSSDSQFSSIETRYLSKINKFIDYNVGLYYFSQNAGNDSNFALGDFLTGIPGVEPPINLISSVDTNSIAVFFNTMSSLTEQLTFEIGGRYVSEDKDASHFQLDETGIFGNTNYQLSRTDSNFSGIISLRYLTDSNVTLYGRYAEGFKSAGFNTDFVSAGVNLEVEPEEASSIEAGVKLNIFNGMMNANFSIFQTQYHNLQLSQVAGSAVSLNNAAKAEISGLEIDFHALIGDYFVVTGSLGYLDASYEDFPGCPSAAANPGIPKNNCARNHLNLAPKWTKSLGLEFVYPLKNTSMKYITRLDWNYRSEVFFDPQNETRLSGNAHNLTNLRVGLVEEQWEAFFWMNNVFDKKYVNFSDDRSAIYIYTTKAYGPPRTYGMTFRYKF